MGRCKFTQAELAEKSGASPSTVSRILAAQQDASEETLQAFANALQVPISRLLPSAAIPRAAGVRIVALLSSGRDSSDQQVADLVYQHVISPAITATQCDPVLVTSDQLVGDPRGVVAANCVREASLLVAEVNLRDGPLMHEIGWRSAIGTPLVLVARRVWDLKETPWEKRAIDYTARNARPLLEAEITAHAPETKTVKSVLASIVRESDQWETYDNPFMSRVAAWRLERVREEHEQIASRRWVVKAESANRYIAALFSRLLRTLQPTEEWITVTNLRFWAQSAVGGSEFLRACRDAAMLGAHVRRVFLIERKKWESEERDADLVHVVTAHEREANSVRTSGGAGVFEVRYFLTDDEHSEERFGHFGVARVRPDVASDDSGCVLVTPQFEGREDLLGMTFYFSRGAAQDDPTTRKHLERFAEAWKLGRTLRELPDLAGLPKDVTQGLARR